MSAASKESLPSWRKAMVANGFGILCIRGPEGEQFTVGAIDAAKAAALNEQGLRPWAMVSEAELRAKLARAEFSESDVEAAIQLARAWATTVTRTSDGN
jgi:hypothetical protein